MRRALCSFIPPHMLRSIAERGDEEARAGAQLALTNPTHAGRRVDGVAVESAYAAAEEVRTFFARVFGHAIDVDGTVHYAVASLAIWESRPWIRPYLTRVTESFDAVAHGVAHGLGAQSGALGEHFADVFAVLARQYARSNDDWLIGAGLFTTRVAGDAIRSMKSPGTAYNDPVLGRDPQRAHVRDAGTSIEPAIDSGIPNRAFYELATLLGGKPWEAPGAIWFRTLTQKLRRRATLQQCADVTWQTAAEMYGAASAPHEAVAAAWNRVGITAGPSEATYSAPAGAAEVSEFVPPLRTRA